MKTTWILRRVAFVVTLPILLLALWWLVSAGSTSPFWPPLSKIFEAFGATWLTGQYTGDILVSLSRLLIGFAGALVLGIVAGLIIGSFRTARALVEPLLEFFRAIPAVVMIPVLILLVGIGDQMKYVMIIAACIWPILLNTIEGVRAVDEVLRETARSYRFRGSGRLALTLRSASPRIMTGARQSLGIAILIMVVSEMFAAQSGLGYMVVRFQQTFRIPEMWSGVLMLGILGVVLSLLFQLIERRVLAWYRGYTNAQNAE